MSDTHSHSLAEGTERQEILNRLRRAEGQLRGIQRMIEEGQDCHKVAQQFAAVRKALDNTHVRMTVCLIRQEFTGRLSAETAQAIDLPGMLAGVENLLVSRN